MKTRLFTPGPTPVPEETLLELAKPVTYHRSAEAKAILAEMTEDLKYVFQTVNPVLTLTTMDLLMDASHFHIGTTTL